MVSVVHAVVVCALLFGPASVYTHRCTNAYRTPYKQPHILIHTCRQTCIHAWTNLSRSLLSTIYSVFILCISSTCFVMSSHFSISCVMLEASSRRFGVSEQALDLVATPHELAQIVERLRCEPLLCVDCEGSDLSKGSWRDGVRREDFRLCETSSTPRKSVVFPWPSPICFVVCCLDRTVMALSARCTTRHVRRAFRD